MRKSLLFFVLFSGAFVAHAAVTTLLCTGKTANSEPLMDFALQLDFDNKQVNGLPAIFTDTEIKWSRARVSNGKVVYDENTLNRLSGNYGSYTQGVMYAGPPPIFNCSKAPNAKF